MYRIGFDIGGTNVVCGILDAENRIIKKNSRPFVKADQDRGALEIAKDLYALAGDTLRAAGANWDEVPSVGLCIPGSVDTARGIVIDAHNLGLHDSPFRDTVSAVFGKPVSMLNDADAAALAEQRLGALAGTQNSMLVTIGTGIGVGIILGGELYHGGRGYGVEAGHCQMDVNGEPCTCGRRGCIETLCAATWLNRRAAELFERAEGTRKELYESFAERRGFDAKAMISAARVGDRECLNIWNRYIDNLANALASYINILDPELIAIGGGVSGAGDFLIVPLCERTAVQSFFRESTPIVRAALGNDAGLVGAVIYGQ